MFRGAGHSPYTPDDFTALAAASTPGGRRAALMALESAGALPARADHRIAATGRSDAEAGEANEIRFAEPPASATN